MKNLLISTGLLLGLMSGQAVALDHNDRPSCYIYVHGQCFPAGKEPQCSQPDYEDALDECDGYYPSVGKRPGSLVSNPGTGSGKRLTN